MLTRRETELFLYLLGESKPKKGHEIAEHFHVTERTVRNDIKAVNEFLAGYSAVISADRNKGYWIDEENRIIIQNDHIVHAVAAGMDFDLPETSNERVIYLLYNMCFGNDYSIEDIEDLFYISRSAAVNDIKVLDHLLKTKLFSRLSKVKNRYLINEPESEIRSVISGIYTQRYNDILELKYSHFITGDESFWNVIYYLSSVITEFCEDMNMQLSGDSIYSFSVDIALSYHRTIQGFPIEKQDRPVSRIGQKLKELLIGKDPVFSKLSDDDYVYLERRLYVKDYLLNDPLPVREEVRSCWSAFISLLERFGFAVGGNEKVVMQQLQKLVLRYRYGYYFNIPEKREICSQYPVFYYFAHMLKYYIASSFRDIRMGLSGVAMLTMILKKTMVFPKKKMILVTDADPWLVDDIREKVMTEFQDELECIGIMSRYEYEKSSLKADLAVTTEPLKRTDIVHVPVHRVCEKNDLDRIRNLLCREESRQSDLKFTEEAVSFESGILALLRRLRIEKQVGCLDFDYVERHLYDCMIRKDCGDLLRIVIPLVSSNRMKRFEISLKEPYTYSDAEYRKIEFISFPVDDTERIRAFFS